MTSLNIGERILTPHGIGTVRKLIVFSNPHYRSPTGWSVDFDDGDRYTFLPDEVRHVTYPDQFSVGSPINSQSRCMVTQLIVRARDSNAKLG